MNNTRAAVLPSLGSSGFDCPYCGVRAAQYWVTLHGRREAWGALLDEVVTRKNLDWHTANVQYLGDEDDEDDKRSSDLIASLTPFIKEGIPAAVENTYDVAAGVVFKNMAASICNVCSRAAIWLEDRVLYPQTSHAPEPHEDMPDYVLGDYKEAAAICELSPRGSAALLRLVVQKLCDELVGKPGKIDDNIGVLVEEGLPKQVIKMLDGVRVLGNNAVHPGSIELSDDRELTIKLFKLVNFIVEMVITRQRMIDDIDKLIPESAQDSIDRRNAKAEARAETKKKATVEG